MRTMEPPVPSERAIMAAQRILAPDRIGFDVEIHLTTGLVADAIRAAYAIDFPALPVRGSDQDQEER